jgi:hypothetical protein
MSATNPFEALRLDPTATEEQIVAQADRLRQRAADEAELAAVRQAVQALTGRAEDRLLHALLTPPRPAWSSPALERFASAFRRPPVAAEAAPPAFDAADMLRLLASLAADELDAPPAPFDAVPLADGPDEVRRQADEALWQSFLYDFRA